MVGSGTIQTIWIVLCPMMGLAFIVNTSSSLPPYMHFRCLPSLLTCSPPSSFVPPPQFSLFLRHYTLTRNYTSASKSGTANGGTGEKEKEAAEQDEDEEEKPTPEEKKKDAWASAEEGGRGRELD